MIEDYYIREIALSYPPERTALSEFLSAHELRFEEDIELAYGVYDEEEVLHGCGCAAGALLKCFALDASLRGHNMLGALVSELLQNRFAAGISELFVITRRHNETLFLSCGFHVLAHTEQVTMLENRAQGPERYAAAIRAAAPSDFKVISEKAAADAGHGPQIGAIVMNCNPFTLGHRALVAYAAARCDFLYLFVVEEDRSMFSSAVRMELVKAATGDLKNVYPVFSGPYMISASTFPSYFLKAGEDAAALQCELDITLFAERIAPALNITVRFAGEEPLDPTTARYNRAMRELLPARGIQFTEIPRVSDASAPISASRVRALLKKQGWTETLRTLVPQSTAAYLERTFPPKEEESLTD